VIAQRGDAADEARVVDAEIEQPLGDAPERAAHVAEVTARSVAGRSGTSVARRRGVGTKRRRVSVRGAG
jgi:hypothetical protein